MAVIYRANPVFLYPAYAFAVINVVHFWSVGRPSCADHVCWIAATGGRSNTSQATNSHQIDR